MLVLASHGEEARGREIMERLAELTGREVNLAAVHITLARCEKKGWVSISSRAPAPGLGGNPRKFFSLTAEGARALQAGRDERTRLWSAAGAHPFLTG